MIKKREYHVLDKSAWGQGPWQDEPDKIQFTDEATGLPCLLVRGPVGSWCGYVGVAEGHPLFKKGYGDCALPKAQPKGVTEGDEVMDLSEIGGKKMPIPARMVEMARQKLICDPDKAYCAHRPEAILNAHGGITFAGFCYEPDEKAFKAWQKRMIESKDEAKQYPKGDAAERWKEQGHLIDDFEGWVEFMEGHSICHVPEPGQPKNVWWLGFDCAHSGDLSPKMRMHLAGMPRSSYRDSEKYRDRAYVEGEVKDLAAQLAAVTPELIAAQKEDS